MTYEDFEKFVRGQCMYETIYDDSDGRPILVIRLLDAYGMVNKAAALAEPEQEHSEQWWRHEVSNAWAEGYEKGRLQREWQGLTDEEIDWLWGLAFKAKLENMPRHFARMVEEKLKEKNT